MKVYLVILALVVSASFSKVEAQDTPVSNCDTNEIAISNGQELIPADLTETEIQKLYVEVCNSMGGAARYANNSIELSFEDKDGIEGLDGRTHTGRSDIKETIDGYLGFIQIAAKDSSLFLNGAPSNPVMWRIVLVHEMSHLFGAQHGADWKVAQGLWGYSERGDWQGIWDTYWWEAVVQYAYLHRCDLIDTAVSNSKIDAKLVCEDFNQIFSEQ